jgi:hypothetical protein
VASTWPYLLSRAGVRQNDKNFLHIMFCGVAILPSASIRWTCLLATRGEWHHRPALCTGTPRPSHTAAMRVRCLSEPGKCWLVGAGPGCVDLMTVRRPSAIHQCIDFETTRNANRGFCTCLQHLNFDASRRVRASGGATGAAQWRQRYRCWHCNDVLAMLQYASASMLASSTRPLVALQLHDDATPPPGAILEATPDLA